MASSAHPVGKTSALHPEAAPKPQDADATLTRTSPSRVTDVREAPRPTSSQPTPLPVALVPPRVSPGAAAAAAAHSSRSPAPPAPNAVIAATLAQCSVSQVLDQLFPRPRAGDCKETLTRILGVASMRVFEARGLTTLPKADDMLACVHASRFADVPASRHDALSAELTAWVWYYNLSACIMGAISSGIWPPTRERAAEGLQTSDAYARLLATTVLGHMIEHPEATIPAAMRVTADTVRRGCEALSGRTRSGHELMIAGRAFERAVTTIERAADTWVRQQAEALEVALWARGQAFPAGTSDATIRTEYESFRESERATGLAALVQEEEAAHASAAAAAKSRQAKGKGKARRDAKPAPAPASPPTRTQRSEPAAAAAAPAPTTTVSRPPIRQIDTRIARWTGATDEHIRGFDARYAAASDDERERAKAHHNLVCLQPVLSDSSHLERYAIDGTWLRPDRSRHRTLALMAELQREGHPPERGYIECTVDPRGVLYHCRFVPTGDAMIAPSGLLYDPSHPGEATDARAWTLVGARTRLAVDDGQVATLNTGEGVTIRLFPRR